MNSLNLYKTLSKTNSSRIDLLGQNETETSKTEKHKNITKEDDTFSIRIERNMILSEFIDQNHQKITKKRAIFSDRKNTVAKYKYIPFKSRTRVVKACFSPTTHLIGSIFKNRALSNQQNSDLLMKLECNSDSEQKENFHKRLNISKLSSMNSRITTDSNLDIADHMTKDNEKMNKRITSFKSMNNQQNISKTIGSRKRVYRRILKSNYSSYHKS